MRRLLRALKSADRLPELARCASSVKEFGTVIPAFLGLSNLTYPRSFHSSDGHCLTVHDFEDLTTLWAVWCADEYRVPSDAKVVVDAGANIGAFSLLATMRAPYARIIAIEPFPSTFEKLLETIRVNHLDQRITSIQAALTAAPTSLFMDADPTIKSHSRRATDRRSDGALKVAGVSLTQLIEEHRIHAVDYLKVDIEGGEVPFFEGTNGQALRTVKKIGVECHSLDGRKCVWANIEAAGFCLDRVSRGAIGSEGSTAEFIRI